MTTYYIQLKDIYSPDVQEGLDQGDFFLHVSRTCLTLIRNGIILLLCPPMNYYPSEILMIAIARSTRSQLSEQRCASVWTPLVNPRRACAARITVLGLSFRPSSFLPSVCYSYHVFCHYAQQGGQKAIPTGSVPHWLEKGMKSCRFSVVNSSTWQTLIKREVRV